MVSGKPVGHSGVIYTATNAGQPWSLVSGTSYDRFELRPGDQWPPDAGASERDELVSPTNLVPFDVDVWLSLALKITAPQITAPWTVIGQFRATDDGGDYGFRSPVFAQELTPGGGFRIVTRSDPAATSVEGGQSFAVRYTDASLPFGQWLRFVYRVRFARTGNGELQAWRDGVEIIPTASIPIGYNDVNGPQWKYGLYRAAGSSDTVVGEYANVEVGTSSLLGRVTNPLPITTL